MCSDIMKRFRSDDEKEGIQMETTDDRVQIKAATLDKLIESLYTEPYATNDYLCSPSELLQPQWRL
jgi:hypothetical protein